MTAVPVAAHPVGSRPGSVVAVGVTAWSVHVPGTDLSDLLPGHTAAAACPPELVHELLGRKGLLYKEPATRLALAAVHRALGRPSGVPRDNGPTDPSTAVIVASNLGNVATVAGVVAAVREGSGRDVSPLAAPNASSNVIASTLAIWFRAGGPNLTVCSGATAGLDAVALGELLLRAGRADRVLVVGVEPDDEVARMLHARRAPDDLPALCAAAACVVLEHLGSDPTGAVALGAVSSGPPVPGPVVDLTGRIGDAYGATGVLNVAVAAALASRGPHTAVCGDAADGWRSVVVG
jgi:3-oxoacyl-[acyl-carrier-protein] synthase II